MSEIDYEKKYHDTKKTLDGVMGAITETNGNYTVDSFNLGKALRNHALNEIKSEEAIATFLNRGAGNLFT